MRTGGARLHRRQITCRAARVQPERSEAAGSALPSTFPGFLRAGARLEGPASPVSGIPVVYPCNRHPAASPRRPQARLRRDRGLVLRVAFPADGAGGPRTRARCRGGHAGARPPRGDRGHGRAGHPARGRAPEPQPDGGRLCGRPARGDPARPRRPTSSIASRCAASSSAAWRPRMAGIDRRVYALTGLGFIGARRTAVGRLARRAVRLLVRGLDDRENALPVREPGRSRACSASIRRAAGSPSSAAPASIPSVFAPAPAAADAAPQGRHGGAHAVVEGHRSRGRGGARRARRRAPRSNSRSTARPTRRTPRPSRKRPCGPGTPSPASPGMGATARCRRGLARPSCRLPAVARRRGTAAHPARSRRLRPRHRHHRRAGLPDARARRGRGARRPARRCRRARRGLRPTGRGRPTSSPGWARRRAPASSTGSPSADVMETVKRALPRLPRADDRRSGAFIRAETRACCPCRTRPRSASIVADEATALWQKTEEELGAIGLPPPFWAFAWAGGQALARYVLDHPETVRGRRVLDFASGSGLVAIAAVKAGAAHVDGLRHRRLRDRRDRTQRRGERRRG